MGQNHDLRELFDSTVSQVQSLLQVDRASIYRYRSKSSSLVLAEAVKTEFPSTQGYIIHDELTSGNGWIERYRRGEYCNIADLSHQIERSSVCSNSVNFNTSAAALFRFFQVKSKLAIPICVEESLWGLLVVHQCSASRQWQTVEIDFLQRLALHLSIAIRQTQLLRSNQQLQYQLDIQAQEHANHLKQKLDFEAMLKRVVDRVRDSLDEGQILQAAVEELVNLLGVYCCQAVLLGGLERKKCDPHPTASYPTVSYPTGCAAEERLTAEIYQQISAGQYCQFCLVEPFLSSGKNAILICPVFDDQGSLGSLRLYAQRNHWFDGEEIGLVQRVASHCAIAIRQARLYQASQFQVQELERLHQLKDDFLSTVSHELRTPLSSIKMVANLLKLTLNQGDVLSEHTTSKVQAGKITQYLKVLEEECDREITLVNDLLTIQHLNAGDHPLSLTTIYLQDWLLEVIEPFCRRTQMHQQRFELRLPNELPSIISDVFVLNRVLVELLNNACKYTPPEGLILVEVDVHSAYFQIVVSNTGVEIALDQLDRIFDPFYRIPNNDPWKHGGTGLGLSLIKKLVQYLGGKIWVESSAQQVHFFVQFPITEK